MKPFIEPDEIWEYINSARPTAKVAEIIKKSLAKNRLNLEEVAILIAANDPESIAAIKMEAYHQKNYLRQWECTFRTFIY